MIKINRKEIFNILQKINISCTTPEIINKQFNEIKKLDSVLELIDLNEYSFDYITNRFIAIKNKNINLTQIKKIIICPFDTKTINIKKCENIIYDYTEKPRNSYLTKPIKEEDRKKFTEKTNEKDCIKGNMNPAILNSIIIYMLNHSMISKETLIIFSLKTTTKWDTDDILEYLQNNIYKFNNSLDHLIDLTFCADVKGKPRKDFSSKIIFRTDKFDKSIPYIINITRLDDDKFKEDLNYTLKIDHGIKNTNLPVVSDFSRYQNIINYFNINLLFQCKLFVFSDKEPSNKFSTFYFDNEFIIEWDSIEKYINILNEILSI